MPDYVTTFEIYIGRGVRHLTDEMGQAADAMVHDDVAEISLMLAKRKQALHLLNYALKLPKLWEDTRRLLLILAPMIERTGEYEEWIPFLLWGIEQSETLADEDTTAPLKLHLGLLYEIQTDYDQAKHYLTTSAQQFARLNRPVDQAKALNHLAHVARLERQFEQAQQYLQQAQQLLAVDDDEWVYNTMVQGLVAYDTHQWLEAGHCFGVCQDRWSRAGDLRMLAWTLTNLGATLRQLQKFYQAIAIYEFSFDILAQYHDPLNQAVAQMNLGNIYLEQDKLSLALQQYEAAEPVFRQRNDQLRQAQIYNNIGYTYYLLQEWDKAENFYALSLPNFVDAGAIASEINVLDGLGLVYVGQGKLDQAKAMFEQALTKLSQIEQDPVHAQLQAAIKQNLAKVV
ncbi:MAG: tetratricopeptide repeat protein [Chloroflexota bacterium]